MTAIPQKARRLRSQRSKKALALPITYLILFASTLLLISVTYVFAVEQVNNRQQSFQTVTAQQDMTSLDNNILSVMSTPGSAATLDFRDSGGQLNIEPSSNNLTLSITDNRQVSAIIFNATTGQVVYDLPSAEAVETGFYIEGDYGTITNQSGASLSQLYISSGLQGPQIKLGFRPAVTYAAVGLDNGQVVNDIRIYIINLNSSDPLSLGGELPLKISCVSTQLTTQTFDLLYQPGALTVTSQLNGFNGTVSVPISSTSAGSIINVQIVCSNITVEEGAP